MTDSSTKAIIIQNSQFFGLLTYTGTGRWRNKETRAWILEWLEAIGDRSAQEVTEELAQRATKWSAEISRGRSAPYPLTIILATFDSTGTNARLSVLSNFENAYGQESFPPGPSIGISTIEATQTPMVLINGWKPPVSRNLRRWLQNATRRRRDQPQRIRQAPVRLQSAGCTTSIVDAGRPAARVPRKSDKCGLHCDHDES